MTAQDLANAVEGLPEGPPFHNYEALGFDYIPDVLYDAETGREIFFCDLPTCRAYKAPRTYEEAMVSLDHSVHHSWISGCSHGG